MNKFPTLFTFTYFHSLAGYCFVLQIFLLRRGVYLNLDSDNTLDLPNQPIFCHVYKQYLGVAVVLAGWFAVGSLCWEMEISFHRGYSFIFALHFVCVYLQRYANIWRLLDRYILCDPILPTFYTDYRASRIHSREWWVVEVVAVSEFTKNNIVVILRNCGV